MSDEKISQLDAASALTGTEQVEVVQSGNNKRTTAQEIANLGGGGGGSLTVAFGRIQFDGVSTYSLDSSSPSRGFVSLNNLGAGHVNITITNTSGKTPLWFGSAEPTVFDAGYSIFPHPTGPTDCDFQLFQTTSGVSGIDRSFSFFAILDN